ncbi:MAG TPA: CGNR zinc finger domain-containing protein [Terriglobales bacterium]
MAHKLTIPIEVRCQIMRGTWRINPNDPLGVLQKNFEGILFDLDARKFRDDFLGIRPIGPELLAFLNSRRIGEIAAHVEEGIGTGRLSLADLIEWRKLIPKLLTAPIGSWRRLKGFDRSKLEMIHAFLEFGPILHFDLSGAVPKANALCTSGVLEGMVLTVFFERLKGDRYRECARPDCDVVFRRETRHKRKFCSWYCGHLVSVRNSRIAKARKEKEG